MFARLLSVGRSYREQITYCFVIGCLLMIVKFGHSTHWTFGLSGGAPDVKSSVAAVPSATDDAPLAQAAPPAVPPVVRSEIRLTDEVAAKAGIEIASVGERPMAQILKANGVVDYDHDHVAQLSVRVPGNVWRVEKRIGQAIHKGDVLAIIEALDVGQAKSDFLQAVVDHEHKQKSLARMTLVGNSVSERALREAQAEVREAKLMLLNAQQRLVNLGLPVHLHEIHGLDDEEIARHVRFLGLPAALVETLDPEATTGNLVPMIAPFDGVVTGRAITIGEVVSPSAPQFVVADVTRMWITLDIRKEDANLVRLGQQITFTPDGMAGALQGQLDWISTELDPITRTLQVRAAVANPLAEVDNKKSEQRLLKAHTFGTGGIVVRGSSQSVVAPAEAVHFDGKEHFVFVRDGDWFRRRVVQTGTNDREWIEIVSGLKSTERIATAGSHVLKAELLLLAGS